MFRLKIFVREAVFPNPALPEQQQERPVPPLGLIGECDDYKSFNGLAKWNDIGSWTMEIPAGSPQAKWFVQGRGIVVFREGSERPMFSGPIRTIEKSFDASDGAPESLVKVTGVDDNVLLAERLAWTNPAQDIHWASKNVHWPVDPSWANIGELLRQVLVNNSQAQQDRWVSKMYVSREDIDLLDDDSRLATLLRFNQMDTEARRMASVYGFRVTCLWHPNPDLLGDAPDGGPGPGILVRIEPVEDLTDTVQFGLHLGNLQSYTYSVSAPTATRAVIAAQHRKWVEFSTKPTYNESHQVTGYTEVETQREGPERYYTYRRNRDLDPDWWGDSAATPADMQWTIPYAQRGLTATEVEWGVTAERLVDESSIDWQWIQDPKKAPGYALDPPAWSKQAQSFMASFQKFNVDNGPSATIEIEPIDTPESKHVFDDFYLGDTIRTRIDEEIWDEVVREMSLSATAEEGHKVMPTVGSDGSTAVPYLYRQVKKLWDEVRDIHGSEDLILEQEPVPVPAFGFSKVIETEV